MSDATGLLSWLASASAAVRRAATDDEIRSTLEAHLKTVPGTDADAELAASELRATAASALAFVGARAELTASLKARESLLASVSHDLRNPLNTFAMSVGLLREDLGQPEIDRARGLSLLERMQRASLRMQQLIEDLLEASRIEAGALELAIHSVPVQEVLDRVLAEHRAAAEEKRAHLTARVDGALRVQADRARLTQALGKIVGYALKNVSEDGSVVAEVHRDGAATVFTVKGIVPGFRPDPIRIEDGRGGLSLLIARGLLRAHDSTLRIETDDATTYAFSLPSAT